MGVYNLYSLANIITTVKSRRMRLAGRIASAYVEILNINSEGQNCLEELDVDRRALEWITRKWNVRVGLDTLC